MSGCTIYGVGLGPGDPDLISVRSDRLIRNASHVAFFRKAGKAGHARTIVSGMLREDVVEIPMEYPVTTEIPLTDPRYNQALSRFYETCTETLKKLSQHTDNIVVLCEGDPFFYGSFMHLYTRLDTCQVEVVPAITGMSGAWTATGTPITWGDDVLTVLAGTLDEAELTQHMQAADAIVVMKIGRNINKVRSALKASGKFDAAWIVEYATMAEQTVTRLSDAENRVTPYFSIIIVHGNGRRP